MKRLLHPFVLVVSAILVIGYAYIATRLTSTAPVRVALAAPFVMVWILPVVYWFGDRDRRSRVHEWVQALSFLCMGWLSFLLVLTVARDVLLLAMAALPPLAAVHTRLDESGAPWVPVAALAAVCVGAVAALGGPYVRRVDIPVEGLSPRVLPRALRRGEKLLDPHALRGVPKWLPINAVAVAEEIGRRGVVREGVDELLSGPGGVGCSVTLKWTTGRR